MSIPQTVTSNNVEIVKSGARELGGFVGLDNAGGISQMSTSSVCTPHNKAPLKNSPRKHAVGYKVSGIIYCPFMGKHIILLSV